MTNLRELHKFRFIELSPSINAQVENLMIIRLPGLARFWEPAKRSLDLEYDGRDDLASAINSIWSRISDELSAAEKSRQDTSSQVLEIKEQHGREQAGLMALQEKLKFLLADKEKYEAFVRKLEQSLEKTGRSIKT